MTGMMSAAFYQLRGLLYRSQIMSWLWRVCFTPYPGDGRVLLTLDNKIWPEHTHGRDTYTGLCGTVCSAEAGKHDGAGAAHGSKEGLFKMSYQQAIPLDPRASQACPLPYRALLKTES